MTDFDPVLQVNLNPANPGQFFACCGLFELADRLWPDAVGWFDRSLMSFHLAASDSPANLPDLLQILRECPVLNTMSEAQVKRLEQLKDMTGKERDSEQNDEKKLLEKLWRERALMLPLVKEYPLELNWFLESNQRGGGSRYKTWAGQQSVIDIARSMKQPLDEGEYDEVPVADCLSHKAGSAVTFNFDSDASAQSSALDVGFSLDPLKMGSQSRPLLELLACIGLQRFRPAADIPNNSYTYTLWQRPSTVLPAMTLVSGCVTQPDTVRYAFPLLYRTQYLKSFLPAQPVT